jgi:hypothetical protein
VAERLAVPLKPGNAGGGKGPRFKTDAKRGTWRLGNLPSPDSVQKLQTALHAKAKAEPGYRFYALYDKISPRGHLAHAYAQCRSNKGAPGVDRQDFEAVEAYGIERWLGELALAHFADVSSPRSPSASRSRRKASFYLVCTGSRGKIGSCSTRIAVVMETRPELAVGLRYVNASDRFRSVRLLPERRATGRPILGGASLTCRPTIRADFLSA